MRSNGRSQVPRASQRAGAGSPALLRVEPGRGSRLATLSPAPGPGPQHGLAELARALAVGLRLRAAVLRLRAASESPRLPSAAGLPRPANDAQPAAALPNRVSAPAPIRASSGRRVGTLGEGTRKGYGGSRMAWTRGS